jgi:hypothetical protein
MSLLEELFQMAQGGSSPQAQILQAMQQGQPQQPGQPAATPAPADSTPTPTVMQPVQDQPGVQVPVPPPRPPAEELAAKPSAVPPPLTPVPGGGNPPDISSLYEKMMDRQRDHEMFWNGAKTLAASYSTPTMASAIMSQGNASSGSPADALTTMLKLQGMQQDKVRLAADLARIPAIAQKLKVDPEVLAQLRTNEPAKYAEIIAKMAVPDNEFLKNAQNQIVLGNKRTGGLDLQGGEEGGVNAPKADPTKSQVIDIQLPDGSPGKQVIDTTTGKAIGEPYKAVLTEADKKFAALAHPESLTDEQISAMGGRPDAWRSKIKFVDDHLADFDLDPNAPGFAAKKAAAYKSIVMPNTGTTVNNAINTVDTAANAGAKKEAEMSGEEAAKREGELYKSAGGSDERKSRLKLLNTVLQQTKQGPLAGVEGQVGSVMKALNLDDDAIKAMGIDPKQAMNNEISNKVASELVVGSIGAKNGGFPASNFSVAERQFIEKMFPSMLNQPGSNQAVTDILTAKEDALQRQLSAYKDYRATNKGKAVSFRDFEDDWHAQHRNENMFDKVIAKSQSGEYANLAKAGILRQEAAKGPEARQAAMARYDGMVGKPGAAAKILAVED